MKKLKWLTNGKPGTHTIYLQYVNGEKPIKTISTFEEYSKDKIIGPPKETPLCTVEELEALGMVGMYEEVEVEENE